MHPRHSIVALTVAATLGLASPAWAHDRPVQDRRTDVKESKERRDVRPFVVVGVVKRAAANGLVLTVKGGNRKDVRTVDVPLAIAPGASIMKNGKPASAGDLKAGDHAMVKGMKRDGKLVAVIVRAASPGAETGYRPSTTRPA